MFSQICPLPPNVIAPRHSSETNTPVSANALNFIDVVYSGSDALNQAAETHHRGPGSAVRDVPDHVRRSRQHLDRGRFDQARALALEHSARLPAVGVRLPVLDLPDLRRLDRRPLRPSAHAVSVRPDLGRRTILTG